MRCNASVIKALMNVLLESAGGGEFGLEAIRFNASRTASIVALGRV